MNWVIVAMVCFTVIVSLLVVMGNWSKVRMAQIDAIKVRDRGPGE